MRFGVTTGFQPNYSSLVTSEDSVRSSYAVFGGVLQSELDFPELRLEKGSAAVWDLRVGDFRERPSATQLLGVNLETRCEIALYSNADGFWLQHSCTGAYSISGDGQEIVWHRAPHALDEMGRADVLGRVLAVAMHASGHLSLHASAVQLSDGVAAFLAPKHHGKSTLALALAAAGGRLVTDDSLPVFPSTPPLVSPGVQSARVCADTANHLRIGASAMRVGVDGKQVLDTLDEMERMHTDAPLTGLYVISLAQPPVGVPIRRLRLPGPAAVMALVQHAKIGTLLGGRERAAVFERAAILADTVPVYTLELTRNFQVLSQVVAQLMEWHGGPCRADARGAA